MRLIVLGRFPPPLDGQTLATRRLAELLEVRHEVLRLNTEPPMSDFVENKVTLRPERVLHYWRLRRKIRTALASSPAAPVLWASISPALLGHWRDMLATMPAFQRQQRVFAVVHRGTFDGLFRSPLTSASARWLVRRLTAFVFLNEALSEACAEWIPEAKRRTIPNAIDEAVQFSDAEIERKQEERRIQEGPLRLLFLSNMIPLKGYLDVVKAVAILKQRAVSVEAHFVGRWGSTDDQLAFEYVIATQGLSDIVTYHGGVDDRETIHSFYESADVFLLPSYHPTEAQPLALIEALNAGIPIVTTDHGGIPFVVRGEKEGIFVPAKDPEAIAAAVSRLQDYGTWRAFSERARNRFLTSFSSQIITQRWESLILD